MNHDDPEKPFVQLSPRADLIADLAGYVLAAALIAVMFIFSGSLY